MSPAALLIIFVTITAVCGGTYLLVNRTLQSRDAAQVHRRVVGNVTSSDEKGKKTAETLFAGDRDEDVWKWLLKKFNVDGQLTALLEQAGKHWAPGQVCITCLGFALVAFNVWWSQAPPLFQKLAFLAAPAAAWIPILYLKRVRTKRIDAFEDRARRVVGRGRTLVHLELSDAHEQEVGERAADVDAKKDGHADGAVSLLRASPSMWP